jgi:hypothetical protein
VPFALAGSIVQGIEWSAQSARSTFLAPFFCMNDRVALGANKILGFIDAVLEAG